MSPDTIGLDDSFFAMGLESRQAMTLVDQVEAWIQIPVDPLLVFNNPTIRELSEQLAGLESRSSGG
jgi:acyl carrier protein